jgi:formylglycine-generating enzyme required for sulfatase activity
MFPEIAAAPDLVRLQPGSFVMGGAKGDKFVTDTERPAHRVMIARSFALGRFPVTVGEYSVFAPGHAPGEESGWPAVNMNWDDALAYCEWLSAETGKPYRLPTEAEWEFACRAGSRGPFSAGDEITADCANFLYAEDGERVGPGRRTLVGSYPPNAFGLHDLHGNVCEWIEDTWHSDYLGAPEDGSAWLDSGDSACRVIRGGAWDYLPRLLRSAWRDSLRQTQSRDNIGFRVALTLSD